VNVTKKAVRGAAWTIPASFGSRAIGIIGTLLIARYLVPDEYGDVTAASIMVLSASQISTFGVGMYVITNPKAPRAEIFHATFWHVALGIVALGAAVLLRGPLGPFFDAPSMGRFVPGLALSVLMDRIAFIPERTLVRDLRFRGVAAMRATGELGFTVVSLGFAMAGHGAMSIVYGNLARSFLKLIATVAMAERRDWLELHPLSGPTMWKLVSYGTAVSLAGIAGFATRRWDNLLVSRYFGPAVMGAYNYAYNLADVPAVQVGEQITDVLLASFPHLEKEKRASTLVRSTTLLALIMFPLAVGLGATAPSVVHAFFNKKWLDIAPMLMWLSLLSVSRPIAGAAGAYFHAINRPRVVMWLDWLGLALVMGCIATFGRLGPRWTCVAVGVAFTGKMLAYLFVLERAEGISMRRMLGPVIPPLVACGPMLAAVVGVRHGLRVLDVSPKLSLVAETAAGALVYVGAALVIARSASQELLRLVKNALQRRRPQPPAAAA
jgi:PST family polysaccharide transporter